MSLLSQQWQSASRELGTVGPDPCKSMAKGQVTTEKTQPLYSVLHGSPVLTLSQLGNSKVTFACLESSFACSLGLHVSIAWACRSLKDGGYQRYLLVEPELLPSGGTKTCQWDSHAALQHQ